MNTKSTDELEKILKSTHIENFEDYCKNHTQDAVENDFAMYIKTLIKQKRLTQQRVFLNADIPERYGYKLLSGEKKTRQRDIILRICYGAEMTLDETQRALRKYEMSELYPKNSRDALLMIIFNERPGDVIDVNTILMEHGMEPLRSSGTLN